MADEPMRRLMADIQSGAPLRPVDPKGVVHQWSTTTDLQTACGVPVGRTWLSGARDVDCLGCLRAQHKVRGIHGHNVSPFDVASHLAICHGVDPGILLSDLLSDPDATHAWLHAEQSNRPRTVVKVASEGGPNAGAMQVTVVDGDIYHTNSVIDTINSSVPAEWASAWCQAQAEIRIMRGPNARFDKETMTVWFTRAMEAARPATRVQDATGTDAQMMREWRERAVTAEAALLRMRTALFEQTTVGGMMDAVAEALIYAGIDPHGGQS